VPHQSIIIIIIIGTQTRLGYLSSRVTVAHTAGTKPPRATELQRARFN
jgi:hypothetical protein